MGAALMVGCTAPNGTRVCCKDGLTYGWSVCGPHHIMLPPDGPVVLYHWASICSLVGWLVHPHNTNGSHWAPCITPSTRLRWGHTLCIHPFVHTHIRSRPVYRYNLLAAHDNRGTSNWEPRTRHSFGSHWGLHNRR
jgi:hypothetical protein